MLLTIATESKLGQEVSVWKLPSKSEGCQEVHIPHKPLGDGVTLGVVKFSFLEVSSAISWLSDTASQTHGLVRSLCARVAEVFILAWKPRAPCFLLMMYKWGSSWKLKTIAMGKDYSRDHQFLELSETVSVGYTVVLVDSLERRTVVTREVRSHVRCWDISGLEDHRWSQDWVSG